MRAHAYTTRQRGRPPWLLAIIGLTFSGLAMLSTLVPVLLTAVSVNLRNDFRWQLIAHGCNEATADAWAWGADIKTCQIQVYQGSLPQVAGARQLGGLRIFPSDLGVVTQVIDGQSFGPTTRLGTGSSDFFLNAAPYAEQLHELTGIATSTILAQWALETSYGQALYGWNFGNIKDPGDLSGNSYQVFTNPEAGLRAEAQLLMDNPAYSKILGQPDPAQAAKEWGRSPWAQSRYAGGGQPGQLLVDIMHTYNLDQYDRLLPPTAGSSDILKPLPTLPPTAPPALVRRLPWGTSPTINLLFSNGQCEAFVEQFYGNNWLYPTAAAAESGPNFHPGLASTAPIGALIYFAPDDDNAQPACPSGCGHVGIKLDADTMLSTSPLGVRTLSISFWSNHYAAVVGWRDPYSK